MTDRKSWTVNHTEVRHIAKPLGSARENGPHLGDLREFVEKCEGLPNDLIVRIDTGHSNESGRRDVVISVHQQQTILTINRERE
jgi:hypothetical protein